MQALSVKAKIQYGNNDTSCRFYISTCNSMCIFVSLLIYIKYLSLYNNFIIFMKAGFAMKKLLKAALSLKVAILQDYTFSVVPEF